MPCAAILGVAQSQTRLEQLNKNKDGFAGEKYTAFYCYMDSGAFTEKMKTPPQPHSKWINNKVRLYSTGSYIQSPGIDMMEKIFKKERICVWLSLYCTMEIRTL